MANKNGLMNKLIKMYTCKPPVFKINIGRELFQKLIYSEKRNSYYVQFYKY